MTTKVATPAIEVRELSVSVRLRDGRTARLVDRISFEVPMGGTLGIVGESGSGKTITSLAMIRLLPRNVAVESGDIRLHGESLLTMSEGEMRRLRGGTIAMVLQDPMTALNPSFTIGNQLADPFRLHRRMGRNELGAAMTEALVRVHIPAPETRLRQYPHQLSGGMRQRVCSAIALAGNPRVLIADEPTTALDSTTQARYLMLLRELQAQDGFALILISHDLAVIRSACERVVIMYSGQVVEQGPVEEVFEHPQHPYTRALLGVSTSVALAGRLEAIEGQAPDPTETIQGCRFAARCKFARDRCRTEMPSLTERPGPGRSARCWGTEPGGWIPT